MGKRTNTILQSAFFALAKVMPSEQAIQFMKDAATKSYLKKGQDIVDMNHKAIDIGATAYKKIDVPADWADAQDEADTRELQGRPEVVKMVKDVMEPIGRMDGDSLPVSAFAGEHVDGSFEHGAAAYEKRGVAVTVPHWNEATCVQCNQCAYVCPHATIRPFALTDEEAAGCSGVCEARRHQGRQGQGQVQVHHGCISARLHGLRRMYRRLPDQVSEDGSAGSQEAAQQDAFDYCVAKVSEKADMTSVNSVKDSQFKKPLLEFSGSCAGCAETSYARLVTQVLRRPHVHLQRYRLFFHLGRPGCYLPVHRQC